jgi:hypothetical protein
MKRSTKLALSLVLAAGTVVPAMAQDNFPDVPANHWAYDALAKLKADGIVVGYPDGLYRGGRPASRYEMAVALHAAYAKLRELIDGLDAQVKALVNVNPQDIQNLKDEIAHLQSEIDAMKGWGDDIAALKRATETFDRELRSLGVDVEAMKKDLGDLETRVGILEKRKPAVDIHGDLTFFAVTTNSENHMFGLTQDGRAEGISGGATIGMFHDLAFLHEGAFTFSGTNDTGPKWTGTVVVGNAMGVNGLGNQSSMNFGGGIGGAGGAYDYSQGAEDVYIQDLEVKWDASVIGLAFNLEGGRIGHKLDDNYMFQRPKNDSYYTNERWDNGEYYFDGAILGFNFGGAKLHVWGGNTSGLYDTQGNEQDPVIVANMRSTVGPSESLFGTGNGYTAISAANGNLGDIDKMANADIDIPLGNMGHVNLAYLLLEQEAGPNGNILNTGVGNRDNVFGGNAELGFGRFKVTGGFHQSDLTSNQDGVNDHDNQAWDANLRYDAKGASIWGGYREVDQHYYAPGDWGRLGILQNPANIKGWQVGGHLDLSKAVRLTAKGEWDTGDKNEDNSSTNTFFYGSPFDTNTTIDDYMVRLDIKLNPSLSVYGSWDDTKFSSLDTSYAFAGGNPPGGDSEYDWATIGFGYGLSSNAKFNLAYQFSNVGNEFVLGGPSRLNGGILTSELSIKF